MAHKRILSFGHAFDGIQIAWREEANFKLHIAAALIALIASWAFRITTTEFLIVLAMIGMVMTSEIFNTALEEFCDKFSPTHDPHIGKIKDLAAAAVLASSLTAFAVGVIIFYPYILAIT